MAKYQGCYTALITPFTEEGEIDYEGLEKLVAFQISQGVSGLVVCGTTGESPTLDWEEHLAIIQRVAGINKDRVKLIAGIGSNNYKETERAAKAILDKGISVSAFLAVDPYYNGPSSLEIRREYLEPLAAEFPKIDIIPYIIPGRTGTQLLAEDLAILAKDYPNVCAVKEATGSSENAARIRACCEQACDKFAILSGDDERTFGMMESMNILADGVISVISNIAPGPVGTMVKLHRRGERKESLFWHNFLSPLYKIITIKTEEDTPYGSVICRARNPLPIKTAMNILGLPAGPCRRPLGKMTKKGFRAVHAAIKGCNEANYELFAPLKDFFGVNVEQQLNHSYDSYKQLYYENY
jgi:4-hydroxy-tetrahydrodipicolinate synthase